MTRSERGQAPQPPAVLDELLRPAQAAALLQLAVRTLANDRSSGRLGIPFVRLGGGIRYRRQDLAAWVSSRVVNPGRPEPRR